MPKVAVFLSPIASDRRPTRDGSQNQTTSDEDGNFKFTGLAPRAYSIRVSPTKGYIQRPVPVSERQDGGYYHIGSSVTIMMIKGGVITGRVSNAMGEALISAQVNVTMTRDAEGKLIRGGFGGRKLTDDRGVYRIYGLQPGSYVVFTRASAYGFSSAPYDQDAPTYHPSSTRDTAAEVMVTSSGEAGGVDIRYRGDTGHVVSGAATSGVAPSSPHFGISVALSNVITGDSLSASNLVRRDDGTTGFSIHGVTDGEYEIIAHRVGYNNEEPFASTPRRVVVRGADVGGIELKLLPLGYITGKFALETAPAICESKRKWSLEETLLVLRHEAKPGGWAWSQPIVSGLTEKGEFTAYNLEANRYFLEPRLPNENWYVKVITASASAPASAGSAAARNSAPADVARNGIALKAGDKVTGVTVTIADGAAGVSGKLSPVKEGSRLPARLRIHLVPVEVDAANEVLRYAEAVARSDGSFSLSNIAPGKYWLIARATPDGEPGDRQSLPVVWDAVERAKLRKEAEAMKIEVELKPCQRATDQVIKYSSK